MAAKSTATYGFSAQDRWVLDMIAHETGTSRNEVLRLALRYYALHGPRHVISTDFTTKIREHYPHLAIAPTREEVG